MDVSEAPPRTAQHAPGDSSPRGTNGDRQPKLGYTRIQGALKNLGHRVARSTIATILKQQGNPPSRERPTSWQTFLRAHWDAVAGADFFTTEVWTVHGLVTYYIGRCRFLICDRDHKWSTGVRDLLEESVCKSFGRRSVRRTAMRTRNALSGP